MFEYRWENIGERGGFCFPTDFAGESAGVFMDDDDECCWPRGIVSDNSDDDDDNDMRELRIYVSEGDSKDRSNDERYGAFAGGVVDSSSGNDRVLDDNMRASHSFFSAFNLHF